MLFCCLFRGRYPVTGLHATVLQHVWALSGHRRVIHLYIHLFTLLLFLPTQHHGTKAATNHSTSQ
jgi:hypothetical protein